MVSLNFSLATKGPYMASKAKKYAPESALSLGGGGGERGARTGGGEGREVVE